jgi:pimeloyl-ACP methyl ester carboxylesterase
LDKSTIVIVPGYNEPNKDMLALADGRRDKPGLRSRGYACQLFPQYSDELSDRINKFAAFLDTLKAGGTVFPVTTLGYSLGGLVTRGFLRRYPERANEVAHTITLGTPHWGLTVDMMPMLTAFFRLGDTAMDELDLNSAFMSWLNGTSGHYVENAHQRDWVLETEPWIAPPDTCLFSIYGAVPRFGGDNDGIVWKDSATLGGRIRSREIRDGRANHLNLIGAWNLGTTLIKGFLYNDLVLAQAIEAVADHIETHTLLQPSEATA